MSAADVILTGIAVVALLALVAVVVGTVWNRRRPRAREIPARRVDASGLMRTTSGVLIPTAQARPRHWDVDLGVIFLVVSWNGRDYLVPRALVPPGFADHLRPVDQAKPRSARA